MYRNMDAQAASTTAELLYKSHQVFMILLGPCWDYLFPYLLNEDIGKIDSALNEKSLRRLYSYQASKFYLVNYILSIPELEWILKRGIDLTICRLDLGHERKSQHNMLLFIIKDVK